MVGKHIVSDARGLRTRMCILDEGDPDGDGGGVCPLLWRMMTHKVFHHCVFGHVLHEIGFLKNERENNHQHLLPVEYASLPIREWTRNWTSNFGFYKFVGLLWQTFAYRCLGVCLTLSFFSCSRHLVSCRALP